MKKLFALLVIAIMLTSCISLKPLPSVCDKLDGPSYLCTVAEKHGMRLEDVGVIIILANAVAIGEGKYTTGDAVRVMKELRSVLDKPVSYVLFKSHIGNALRKYPGLLVVADFYIADLTRTQFMYNQDRLILRGWLDARISGLESFL